MSLPSEPALVVREAAAADAPAIESLYRELVSDPLICVLPGQVEALAAAPASFLLVIEGDGAIQATALLTICPDTMYRAQPFGVVENVIVASTMRKRGVGRLLLAHIERLASAHHCTKLMLWSSSKRVEAHGFFRRCGFGSEAKLAFVKYRSQWEAAPGDAGGEKPW